MVFNVSANAIKLWVESSVSALSSWDMVQKEAPYQEYRLIFPSQITWNLYAQGRSIGTMITKIISRNVNWNCITTILLSISLRRQRRKYRLCHWRTVLLRWSMRRNACFQFEINSLIISSRRVPKKICLAGKLISDIGYTLLPRLSKFVTLKSTWTKCRRN